MLWIFVNMKKSKNVHKNKSDSFIMINHLTILIKVTHSYNYYQSNKVNKFYKLELNQWYISDTFQSFLKFDEGNECWNIDKINVSRF